MLFAIHSPIYFPWLRLTLVMAMLLPLLLIGKVPLAYNLRNLTVRWKTTALTAIAFTLVIGLLTVMLAFVNGMDRLLQRSGQPGNVIVLQDGATDELFSTVSPAETSDILTEPGIQRNEAGRPIYSRELYMVVNQSRPSSREGKPGRLRIIQVRGIEDPEAAFRVHGLELYPGGTWFSPAGVQDLEKGQPLSRPAIQAILAEGVARQLGPDQHKGQLALGDVFELGGREWVVVGIMKSSGTTFNSEVWAKAQTVDSQFGKQSVFTSVVLRTPDPNTARTLSEALVANPKVRLQALPETEYYAKHAETKRLFQYAIYLVAIIMGIGAAFGVMTTMCAAVSQRIKDIGLLRAFGYARWQILVSFLLETFFVALFGGLLGVALGYLADGRAVSSIVSDGQGGGQSVLFELVVDVDTLTVGLIFTLGMGMLGGLLPAWSAMRLKPLEALR